MVRRLSMLFMCGGGGGGGGGGLTRLTCLPLLPKHRVNSCPTKVYRYEEGTHMVEIEDAARCTFCDECKQKAVQLGVPDLVSVRLKQDRFLFTVETTGALRPEEVMRTALNIIHEKLTNLQSHLSVEQETDPH